MAISVKFMKTYILLPVILNLGIILQRYLYIRKWYMRKSVYCNIVRDQKTQVKSMHSLPPAMGLHFTQRIYPSLPVLAFLSFYFLFYHSPFTDCSRHTDALAVLPACQACAGIRPFPLIRTLSLYYLPFPHGI